MEVPVADDDLGAIMTDSLSDIAPFAGDLDGSLDRLHAGVHRKHGFLAAQRGKCLCVGGQPVAAKCPAGQSQRFQLTSRRGDQSRVLMAEVEGRVAGKEVQICTVINVIHPTALATGKYDRQWCIIVGEVGCFGVQEALAECHSTSPSRTGGLSRARRRLTDCRTLLAVERRTSTRRRRVLALLALSYGEC